MNTSVNARSQRERKSKTDELTEVELSKVTGGSVSINPVSITKKVDAASPKLFL